MFKALFFFVLGAVAGVFATRWYLEDSRPATASIQQSAGSLKDSVNGKLRDWHLTPEEIKVDLQKSGEVVRSKAISAGEKINDGRIVAQINAKYVLDSDLSARAIDVDCSAGKVTLNGTVPSEALLGRAVALALETTGVTNVVSKLSVKP